MVWARRTADRPSGQSGQEGIWPWLGKRGHLGDWRRVVIGGSRRLATQRAALGGTLNPAGRMTRQLGSRRVAATGLLRALSSCELQVRLSRWLRLPGVATRVGPNGTDWPAYDDAMLCRRLGIRPKKPCF